MIPTGQKLLSVLLDMKPQRVAVFGDLILDQYTWCNIERISPEAPIPVARTREVEYRGGGAACAALNLKALDCDVDLFGLVGNDAEGRRLSDLLTKAGITCRFPPPPPDFKTILKNRILTKQQQILRIDTEDLMPIQQQSKQEVLEIFQASISSYSAVLLSDYSKGFLSDGLISSIIKLSKDNGVKIVVDPGRGRHPSVYFGATTMKPNRAEAELVCKFKLESKENILKAAEMIQRDSDCDFISLSLDKDGVLLYRDRERHIFYPAQVREVFDITGAGDTFVSVLAASLADNSTPECATALANIAAGISTSRQGVVHITRNEIARELNQLMAESKMITTEEIKLARSRYSAPLPLIFTNGIFDDLNIDQILFINELQKLKGDVVIALNSDDSVMRLHGRPPRLPLSIRLKLLSGFDFISWLLVFDETDATKLIKELRPEIVVKGSKHSGQIIPEQVAILETGARLEFIRPTL